MGRETALWLAAVVWLAAVAGGFGVWERYDTTAGAAAEPCDAHPPPTGRWQLIVFAHPKCPCTRAMLRELDELRRAAPDCTIRVRFVRPAESADGWERGETWDATARLPGVEVECDRDGNEARQFGARTSGYAVLVTPGGDVVFRGGLTRGRGREGESPGRRAVLEWVANGTGPAALPAYGCGLFTADE